VFDKDGMNISYRHVCQHYEDTPPLQQLPSPTTNALLLLLGAEDTDTATIQVPKEHEQDVARAPKRRGTTTLATLAALYTATSTRDDKRACVADDVDVKPIVRPPNPFAKDK
jgi:hypothetical protein